MVFGKELEDRDEKCRVWMDNQRWKSDELVFYFEAMQKKLHALDPQLYLCPDLSQWGYFLNVDGSFLTGAGLSDLWDTAVRGADFTGLPRMWMRRILFLCRCFQTVTRTAM